jgi:hypothetical protein
MAKKYSLNVSYKPDYKIIGVFCPVKDYRFCWILNDDLGYSFNHYGTFNTISTANDSSNMFNVYEYYHPLLLFRMFILNNKNHNRVIFPSPPNLDYLIVIEADEYRIDINEILSSVRSVKTVNAAFILESQLGKSFDQVFYDFELFVTNKDNIIRDRAIKYTPSN